MSGLTPTAIAGFRRMLRDRGSSMEALADEIGVARNTLWRALRGHLAPEDLLRRIYAATTAAEWAQLVQLEHLATWNRAQSARDAALPDARHWLMRQQCASCRGDRHFVPCCRSMARQITHGICADCLQKLYPELARTLAQPAAA